MAQMLAVLLRSSRLISIAELHRCSLISMCTTSATHQRWGYSTGHCSDLFTGSVCVMQLQANGFSRAWCC
jgi:hypothetical protein